MQKQAREIHNIKTITQIGLLIALSIIGATIKIQGSIAFDSMAAFFAALYINPLAGGVVGILGHLISSATAGFPLTLPMHILIGIQMFAFVYIFGWLYEKTPGGIPVVVATLLNGPMAALTVVPMSLMLGLPFSGWPLFMVIWLPLTIASFANILLAVILYRSISRGR
ncbi:ECF transporter S component [Natronincola ferrireducens]|uniref:Alpha-ribazole transporter n=1 Tax=Natronincola ferrireducens TaxID=393762 RepID=A0A1G8WRB1_9FIRM|nr:ECF transporter S component [Natronincola ferrireducens]SDJ80741.1 alpha-ribazole transporter [Natronincola ferrireducens]